MQTLLAVPQRLKDEKLIELVRYGSLAWRRDQVASLAVAEKETEKKGSQPTLTEWANILRAQLSRLFPTSFGYRVFCGAVDWE